ncbi:hypothetical protein [Kitasatospora sp. NPDC057015]|uniref:hypothetical protein n=1 Tax=Kitasatospora sp. NPDC057015 TaxID=3346001 RepID=UPI003628E17B
MVSTSGGRDGGHDHTALDEIELAGELMIAATDSVGDRLPTERIDEVLLDRADRTAPPAPGARRPGSPDHDRREARTRPGGPAATGPTAGTASASAASTSGAPAAGTPTAGAATAGAGGSTGTAGGGMADGGAGSSGPGRR